MYKLIAYLPEDRESRVPFYGYTVEDENGKELGSFTKVVFTLDPDKEMFGKLTLHRKYVEEGILKEEILENVDAEIDVRNSDA